jgi:hypothetical protein
LDPDAVSELEDLGVLDYQGKAVVTDEETQSNAVRVTFDPESGPICMRGAEFAAFYEDRPSSDQLMILLDGGGACWSGFCFADETADATITAVAMASTAPDNYFNDWDIVYAPYCDGSVFSGDNEVTEPDGSTRYHHGLQNLAAAIDLATEHFPGTKEILLAGFSAGGYGTITGMVAVRLAFPDADLYVLDDSGPGVQNLDAPEAIDARIADWRFDKVIPASCTTCEAGHGQLSEMFTWMLKRDDTVKISVLSYLGDDVIGGTFLALEDPVYEALLHDATDKIHDAYPDRFQRFMLPGNGHVLSGAYTTLTAGGVNLKDWTEAMAKGDEAVWKDNVASGP